MTYKKRFHQWIDGDFIDENTREELLNLDESEIKERFYKDLEFGTAGLRGIIGAGTNRLNRYTVSQTVYGLGKTILEDSNNKSVVIGYDVRHKSKEFAILSCEILAAMGIKVYLFDSIRPTPLVAFAIRRLGTKAGMMITASHNPKEYNGLKIFWEEGSQILEDIANSISKNQLALEFLKDIDKIDFQEAIDKGSIELIGRNIDDEYIELVKSLRLSNDIDKNISGIYTPLNGTASNIVDRLLREEGFEKIELLKEQSFPDPDFKSVGYPNPEYKEAFNISLMTAKEKNSEIILANDPDGDRLAVMVKDSDEFRLLTGNEVGILLSFYMLDRMRDNNVLKENSVIVRSIVTGNFVDRIAEEYRVKVIETLTGFKNISGQIKNFEENNSYSYLLGYEESIGYAPTDKIRDKDGISTALLMVEMAAYYKKRGKSLIDILEELYEKYGYYGESLFSISFKGIKGKQKLEEVMNKFRQEKLSEFAGLKVSFKEDFLEGVLGFAKSNVLRFFLDKNYWFAIRPSGTEPKLKVYIYGSDQSEEKTKMLINNIEEDIRNIINNI